MSKKTNSLQNQLLQEPDGGDGLDFEYIMKTINEAPEDLKDFAEALHSLMYDKLRVAISFEDGFVLSDRLNKLEIDRLRAELDSFKRPENGEPYEDNSGWGTEHEAARYRHIHKEVEAMGGWANYRHFMRVERYKQAKEFKDLKEQVKLLEHKLRVVIENGLGPEDLKPQDV